MCNLRYKWDETIDKLSTYPKGYGYSWAVVKDRNIDMDAFQAVWERNPESTFRTACPEVLLCSEGTPTFDELLRRITNFYDTYNRWSGKFTNNIYDFKTPEWPTLLNENPKLASEHLKKLRKYLDENPRNLE